MTNSGSAGDGGMFAQRRDRFNRWRRGRPFAGGALLILASLVIAWIPINIAPDTILIGAAISPTMGLLFAALVFLCGMFALTRPGLADIFGIFGGVFSLFSLYGALGGFFIGTALGLVGANLCYAWRDEDEAESGGGSGDTEDEESDFDFDGQSTEEDSDGLFGTRSHHTRAAAEPATDDSRTASVALFIVSVVVLGAFAHPLVAAAAQPFPEQAGIDGTIVIAEEFSGQRFSHANVTTDTSDRDSVSAGKFSFSSATIEGMTVYKNFRGGPGGPSHLTIKGSSASAPNGLSLTTSEAYFARLGIGVDPVVIPAARQKWSTCPGQDFLFRTGDLGPLPGPPIDASGVTTNTHQLFAPSITIENLELTMREGTKSTSVQGTPECTRNPVEPVLDLFTANALALLTDEGVISPNVTTSSAVSELSAPSEVNRSETFNVSATITNTGFVNDTKTVEYRFDGAFIEESNVTLAPDESTTVTFADTANASAGSYEYSLSTRNDSATGTITVAEPSESGNESAALSNVTGTTGSVNTTDSEPSPTNETNGTAGNETTTAPENDTATETTTPADENTSTSSPTETTAAGSETATPTTPDGAAATDTSGNETETRTTTATPTATETPTATTTQPSGGSLSAAAANGTETGTTAPSPETSTAETTATNGTANESSRIGFP